jgi:hypothetical protein
MDSHMVIKVLAALAIVFVLYKVWENFSGKKIAIPNPYKKAEFYMNSAEGSEYDMEDDDEIYYPESDEEDDDIVNLEGDDMFDGEDDDVYVEEGDDMADAETYDTVNLEGSDIADAETSVPKVMQPMMPLLTPSSQLLPKPSPEAADFDMWAPKNLQAQNFLTATQWIGVNTQGSSLKNANYDLRADPIIPKADIGPWQQSSIDPNIYSKPLFG